MNIYKQKKEGLFVSRHPILANLKSNTMKTDAKLVVFVFAAKFLFVFFSD